MCKTYDNNPAAITYGAAAEKKLHRFITRHERRAKQRERALKREVTLLKRELSVLNKEITHERKRAPGGGGGGTEYYL
jgi:hypothetical protein